MLTKIRYCLVILLLLIISLYFSMHIYNNRIVAKFEDNRVYYDNYTYVEVFNQIDLKTKKCLGSIEIFDEKFRIYSLVEQSDYLYIDMGLDYRIFKLNK